MTQKELAYVVDAVKHEDNVIKIIDISLDNLNDDSLLEFMNDERQIHENMKENLTKMLEVKANE